jgi:hypothetical protein
MWQGFVIVGVVICLPWAISWILPRWVERQERKNPGQAAYMRRVDDDLTARGL